MINLNSILLFLKLLNQVHVFFKFLYDMINSRSIIPVKLPYVVLKLMIKVCKSVKTIQSYWKERELKLQTNFNW